MIAFDMPAMLSLALLSSQATLLDEVKHCFHACTMGTELHQRIRAIRTGLGITQEEFGARFGVSKAAVSQWEAKNPGIRTRPDLNKLKAIAISGGRSLDWLTSDSSELVESSAQIEAAVEVVPVLMGARRVPLISTVQAGAMTEMVASHPAGFALDWLLTDLDISSEAFALEIKGDSMLPDFKEGDRVIIDPAIEPMPGDFVVARNGDHEATFKKYRPRGVTEGGQLVFELVPLNEDYPSMRSDVTPIRIIGTMVEHRRYRRR